MESGERSQTARMSPASRTDAFAFGRQCRYLRLLMSSKSVALPARARNLLRRNRRRGCLAGRRRAQQRGGIADRGAPHLWRRGAGGGLAQSHPAHAAAGGAGRWKRRAWHCRTSRHSRRPAGRAGEFAADRQHLCQGACAGGGQAVPCRSIIWKATCFRLSWDTGRSGRTWRSS